MACEKELLICTHMGVLPDVNFILSHNLTLVLFKFSAGPNENFSLKVTG